jgi:hypothetical protein
MRRGETILAYALRLKGMSRELPGCAFEEVVKQRCVGSITPSMRKDAALVSGAQDVSKMVLLEVIHAAARGTGALRTKRVERWWKRCGLDGGRIRTAILHSRTRSSGCQKKLLV